MNLADLRRELGDQPVPDPLDPELLVRLAQVRQRGVRRTRGLLLLVSGVLVVAVGLTTAVRAGWLDRGSQAYVAGMPSTTPPVGSTTAAPTPSSSATPTAGGTFTSAAPLPTPSTGPSPVPAVGEPPAVRALPDNTWVEVVPGVWFATWQTNWVLVDGLEPTDTPSEACRAGAGSFGCRGTVRNANIDSTFSSIQSTDNATITIASSVFRGAPMSATATLPGGRAYWGVLCRLAGVPGWTFAVWTTPSLPVATPTPGVGMGYPFISPTYRIFDAAGAVTGSYPS